MPSLPVRDEILAEWPSKYAPMYKSLPLIEIRILPGFYSTFSFQERTKEGRKDLVKTKSYHENKKEKQKIEKK